VSTRRFVSGSHQRRSHHALQYIVSARMVMSVLG
jgi:hypothetical protein